MENDEIVDALELLVKLWDVHGVHEFKSKNLAFANRGLDKYSGLLSNLSIDELVQIPGVGKVIVQIVYELAQTGKCKDLDDMMEQTPSGILDLLRIKGLGPKKVHLIWHELGITALDDLLVACENNTLETIKGFGKSVQENVRTYILFLKEHRGKLRLDKATLLSQRIESILENDFSRVAISGELRRNCEVIASLVFVVECENLFEGQLKINESACFKEDIQASSPFTWRGHFEGHLIPIDIYLVDAEQFNSAVFQHSAHAEHLSKLQFFTNYQGKKMEDEKLIYQVQNLPFVVPEMREGYLEFQWSEKYLPTDLIEYADLKGCLHNHSTYSDGKNSLREMAEACRSMGLTYFGIADHSQYAAYAGGLKEEQIYQQHEEIDALNLEWDDFQILKGIESDILPDGSLDYNPHILSTFDYVVASVHAQLNMDLDRAMSRLIRAIENPYTTILGHPTGRLLLTRSGYPLDMIKILDACRSNSVSIELNASPYRLDLDWRHIYAAMDRGVMVSINPDAHKITGLLDMQYGVKIGRKGGLLRELTLNALDLTALKINFQKIKN